MRKQNTAKLNAPFLLKIILQNAIIKTALDTKECESNMLEFSIKNTVFFVIIILICSTRMLKGKLHYDKIQWYSCQGVLIFAIVALVYQLCDFVSILLQ